jgi:transposase InsO family protein
LRSFCFRLAENHFIPFFNEQGVKLLRVLIDRGSHSRTKTKSPPTGSIVERFHKTMLSEFFRIGFRKKLYGSIADLQADLDQWLEEFNWTRSHQGAGASAKPRCRPSLTQSRSRRKK